MAELTGNLNDPQQYQRPVGVQDVNRNNIFSATAGFLDNLNRRSGNGPSATETRNLLEDDAVDAFARDSTTVLSGGTPEMLAEFSEMGRLKNALDAEAIDKTTYDVQLNR